MDVIGIGVAVLDVVMAIDRHPSSDEVCRAIDRRINVGGGVVVAMATAAARGVSTGLIDTLGDDAVGNIIRGCLDRTGIHLDLMQRSQNSSSSIASVWSKKESSQRSIVFSPGRNANGQELELQFNDDIETAVAEAKILHLNGRHHRIAQQAIDVAQRSQTLVSYDGGAGRFRDEIVPLIRAADILVVASQFAKAFYDHARPNRVIPPDEELASWMQFEVGCQLAGVTFGLDGSYFASDDAQQWHQPALNADRTVDATGCGDAFRGGMLAAMIKGDTWRSATAQGADAAMRMAEILGSGLV